MRKSIATPALIAALMAAATLFAPLTASAREASSSRSVGHGIKCYNAYTQNADGSYSWKQICYKGV